MKKILKKILNATLEALAFVLCPTYTRTVVVIPARYNSTRLPGKVLLPLGGMPMLWHVYRKCIKAGVDESDIYIVTDDVRVKEAMDWYGIPVHMTSADHVNGTSRIAELVDRLNLPPNTIVVNVQGDEPDIDPVNIKQVLSAARESMAEMFTLRELITDVDDLESRSVVKVHCDSEGYATRFTRKSPLTPNGNPSEVFYRHVGIYAYSALFLKKYVSLETSESERMESLEQCRVLDHGYSIEVQTAIGIPSKGIDTKEEYLELVEKYKED